MGPCCTNLLVAQSYITSVFMCRRETSRSSQWTRSHSRKGIRLELKSISKTIHILSGRGPSDKPSVMGEGRAMFIDPTTITHALEVIYIYCMVEIFYNVVLLHISSHLCIQWHYVGSLKLVMVGEFTTRKLANTTNWSLFTLEWAGS